MMQMHSTGNGFASFKVNGSCDTIWAGHVFFKEMSVIILRRNAQSDHYRTGGSIAGGQGNPDMVSQL